MAIETHDMQQNVNSGNDLGDACQRDTRQRGGDTVPNLSFLDDNPDEWVGGHWIRPATMAEREVERRYDELERAAIAEFGGG